MESENERLENKNYKLEQNLKQCENGYDLELHTTIDELTSKFLERHYDSMNQFIESMKENVYHEARKEFEDEHKTH